MDSYIFLVYSILIKFEILYIFEELHDNLSENWLTI